MSSLSDGLSEEVVIRFQDLLTSAIEWYEADLKKREERDEAVRSSEDIALAEIKVCVRDGSMVKRRIYVDVLVRIVKNYERYLGEQRAKDPATSSPIDDRLSEIRKFWDTIY